MEIQKQTTKPYKVVNRKLFITDKDLEKKIVQELREIAEDFSAGVPTVESIAKLRKNIIDTLHNNNIFGIFVTLELEAGSHVHVRYTEGPQSYDQ